MSRTLGFIGVGMMGHGMAKNLLENGLPVVVLAHRDRTRVDSLVAMGPGKPSRRARSARAPTRPFSASPARPRSKPWSTVQTGCLPVSKRANS